MNRLPDRLPAPAPSARLSLNQWTTRNWTVPQAVDGCLRHGIGAIGLWREEVAEYGLAATAKRVADAGLRVSSLCRGGFLNTGSWLEENRRAIDEAAELEAACLVLVVGGLPGVTPGEALGERVGRDLAAARRHVADALDALVPIAAERGVRLALEPLHPMYCADRAVLSTLKQALDLAAPYPGERVGVCVDAFHVWWDPEIYAQIERAGRDGRIASFQLCDFLVPLPSDVLLGRGMMGDGVIDFPPLYRAVAATGYTGDIEVEIFNADIWAADPDTVVATMRSRYEAIVHAAG